MPFDKIGNFSLDLICFCLKTFVILANLIYKAFFIIFTANRAKILLLAPFFRTFLKFKKPIKSEL